jgi:hypothetical protein
MDEQVITLGIASALRALRERHEWLCAIRGHISAANEHSAPFGDHNENGRNLYGHTEWTARMREAWALTNGCLHEIDAELVALNRAIKSLEGITSDDD